uniref:Uncharacterized protein n=1 Tax=Cacopsylla melanoneura TaxID=428564 RepID=A0A8D8Q1Q4_9HEMI
MSVRRHGRPYVGTDKSFTLMSVTCFLRTQLGYSGGCSVAPQDNFAFLLFLQKLAKVYRKYFTVQTNGGPWSNIAGIPTCGRCGTQRFNYTSFFKEENALQLI